MTQCKYCYRFIEPDFRGQVPPQCPYCNTDTGDSHTVMGKIAETARSLRYTSAIRITGANQINENLVVIAGPWSNGTHTRELVPCNTTVISVENERVETCSAIEACRKFGVAYLPVYSSLEHVVHVVFEQWETVRDRLLSQKTELQKVETKMSEPTKTDKMIKAATDMATTAAAAAKDELGEGGWLTLGKQTAKRTRALVKVAVASRFPSLPLVERFLLADDDMALAIYAIAAGAAASATPKLTATPYRAKLARSMRVWGFHIVTDAILDPILDELTSVFDDVISKAGLEIANDSK